jgi:hypothetical protein
MERAPCWICWREEAKVVEDERLMYVANGQVLSTENVSKAINLNKKMKYAGKKRRQ